MTNSETAKRFGVSTPETSKELDWKGKYYFAWIWWIKDYVLCYQDQNIGMWRDLNTNLNIKRIGSTVIPAPQMHEIAEHLPSKWTLDSWANQLHFENYVGDDPTFMTYIQNQQNNYTEAFAQLYLRLRKESLI